MAGIMKPDITFFGEPLPDEFSRRLTEHDRDRVDLVIVIGTSLKVTPVSEIVSWLPPHIPQIYISKTPITHINFDIDLLGDCDVVIAELCRRAGWDLHHEMIPKGQRVDVRLEDGFQSRHCFAEATPAGAVAAPPAVLQEKAANGAKVNGVKTNGVKTNGVKINGKKLNGKKLNGTNGVVRKNGVKVSK
jgi:NAD+-dependent protein deacetylase SIR2